MSDHRSLTDRSPLPRAHEDRIGSDRGADQGQVDATPSLPQLVEGSALRASATLAWFVAEVESAARLRSFRRLPAWIQTEVVIGLASRYPSKLGADQVEAIRSALAGSDS